MGPILSDYQCIMNRNEIKNHLIDYMADKAENFKDEERL